MNILIYVLLGICILGLVRKAYVFSIEKGYNEGFRKGLVSGFFTAHAINDINKGEQVPEEIKRKTKEYAIIINKEIEEAEKMGM